jgi:hypothetical protein
VKKASIGFPLSVCRHSIRPEYPAASSAQEGLQKRAEAFGGFPVAEEIGEAVGEPGVVDELAAEIADRGPGLDQVGEPASIDSGRSVEFLTTTAAA